MTSSYGSRPLYGGAMSVELPQEYIDSSDLRQIPDHQEVFLSPTKLTSIIFEINEYIRLPSDEAAVQYHFTDVIVKHDELTSPLPKPDKITLVDSSLASFSAYTLSGAIKSQEVIKPIQSALPVEWQERLETRNVMIRVHQLVVRLAKPYESDLCVRINVPMKELKTEQEQNEENAAAVAMMQRVVQTLAVKDFGLFGS